MESRPALPFDELCNELLSLIEIEEAKMLNWGFYDVRSNLSVAIENYLTKLPSEWQSVWIQAQKHDFTAEKLLANLSERHLILKFSVAGHTFYRTRFAEAIRLLYLLRQRFTSNDWYTASPLVSDLKIQLRRRQYPKRDIEAKDLIQELRELRVPTVYLEAISSLLQSTPGVFLKLARFQKDAIIQQARSMLNRGERAITIGAGTGSGKTKAFYIPAMAEIAAKLLPDKFYVQALAIYPRTELLKDQLQEAFFEARKLDALLYRHTKRSITIAAYYGDTPLSAEMFLTHPPESWQQNTTNDGWICPFFSCPHCHSQELTWYRKDIDREQKEVLKGNREGKYARLICPNADCRTEITSKQLLLTRQQIINQPPDILFTTTEMLNRRLSRTSEHHLFGLSPTHTPPRLVLLDEIHTYEDTHGAQIAYLLRRWKYARQLHHQTNLCFVGLSATLTNAEAFFSKLTGVPIYHVSAISPREQDLIEEGLEYNVVLKGDPVSGTSLLSTSVQTAMLLGRMLDPDSVPTTKATYGKKIFAFADKLDVLNRWYHIEQEAEVLRTLSKYRDCNTVDKETRRKMYLLGQDWKASQVIGHNLYSPLRLDLTSSQYRGVNAQANFIIATSTLEVGFNDPDVGMVIQHKAPRSMASFLQRKGRAGRQRHMRPWMVVVTSAYGRDRWAFQHTEQLFYPQLEALNLPIDNYYVRKIQATYTLMDWLAFVLAHEWKHTDIDIWRALSSKDQGASKTLQYQRKLIYQILDELLRGKRRQKFESYLTQALDISDNSTLYSLLWGQPRSLFYEVIPTVMRQIASNWQSVEGNEAKTWTDTISNNPMPDYMPPTLFSDLNLPELLLHILEQPKAGANSSKATQITVREDVYLPLAQALQEFAPGHVNKRYARKQYIREAHWLALPEAKDLTNDTVSIQSLSITYSPLAKPVTIDHINYMVFQPQTYTLGLVPHNVKNSSNGHLIWDSHFLPKHIVNQAAVKQDNSTTKLDEEILPHLSLAPNSPWKRFFNTIESYTQVNGHWVEITRLAIGVNTETFYTGNTPTSRRSVRFIENNQPAALGFTIYADALRFEFLPVDTAQIFKHPAWPALYQHLGPEYFLYKLQQDQRLQAQKLTSFEIGWLWQLEMSMLVAFAVAQNCSLQQSALAVQNDREGLAKRAMEVIFQSIQSEEEDDGDRVGRLHQNLLTHMNNPIVQSTLAEHETMLWNKQDPGISNWLSQCYASSLGTTLFTALVQLLPDINAESLFMDIEGNSIWISEETGGGIGLVSRIAESISLRPGEFDLQMQDILEHCERGQLADQLQLIANSIGQAEPQILAVFARLRENSDLPRQIETRQALTHILEHHGIAPTRNLIVALNSKFLRPELIARYRSTYCNVSTSLATRRATHRLCY